LVGDIQLGTIGIELELQQRVGKGRSMCNCSDIK